MSYTNESVRENNEMSLDLDLDLDQLLGCDAQRRVTFEEQLQLVNSDGLLVDEVTVAVEYSDQEDLLSVYQYSQGDEVLLRIRSQVNRADLATELELRRIKSPDKTKILRITECNDTYQVLKMCCEGTAASRVRTEIEKSAEEPVFLEGSNILLLRMIAQNGLRGQFKCQTINHEGELCECVYKVQSDDESEEGDVRVTRAVTGSTDQQVMTTVLSRDGHILSHQWDGSEWCLMAAPRPQHDATAEADQAEEQTELEPKLNADKEAYFTKKEELLEIMNRYFRDNCDFQDLIADLVKNLLFDKPEDAIDYADTLISEFVGINTENHQLPTMPRSASKASAKSSQYKTT